MFSGEIWVALVTLTTLEIVLGVDNLVFISIAVSRLLLDNVDHIKAYWVSMTPDVAQIALRFGADDIDGTIVHETIYKAAGTSSPGSLGYDELVRLIREAGRTPIERDTHYNVVREHTKAQAPEASMKVRDRKRQLAVVS